MTKGNSQPLFSSSVILFPMDEPKEPKNPISISSSNSNSSDKDASPLFRSGVVTVRSLPIVPLPSLSPLQPPEKSDEQKSETWLSLLSMAGTVAGLFVNSTSHIASLASILIAAGTFAYCRSPLATSRPGFRTPAFAVAVVSIVGSIAAALADAQLPFLGEGVTKNLAVIAAGVSAAGYTIWRYQAKKAFAATFRGNT